MITKFEIYESYNADIDDVINKFFINRIPYSNQTIINFVISVENWENYPTQKLLTLCYNFPDSGAQDINWYTDRWNYDGEHFPNKKLIMSAKELYKYNKDLTMRLYYLNRKVLEYESLRRDVLERIHDELSKIDDIRMFNNAEKFNL